MIYEYIAEAHRRETPFVFEERFLFHIPVRMLERGDLVSHSPFGPQSKVRWPRFWRWTYWGDMLVYVDAKNTRGWLRREVVDE